MPWATPVTKLDLLGAKVRELIAPGVRSHNPAATAVLLFHADAAVKAGATDAEIAEALGVAINLKLARRSFIQPGTLMPSVRHAVKH